MLHLSRVLPFKITTTSFISSILFFAVGYFFHYLTGTSAKTVSLDRAQSIAQSYLGNEYEVSVIESGLSGNVVRVRAAASNNPDDVRDIYVLPSTDSVILGTMLTQDAFIYPLDAEPIKATRIRPQIEPQRKATKVAPRKGKSGKSESTGARWYEAPSMSDFGMTSQLQSWLEILGGDGDGAQKLINVAKSQPSITQQSAGVNNIGLLDVYIYFDPHCPHCHNLVNYLKERKDIRAHWIPVSVRIRLDEETGNDLSLTAAAIFLETLEEKGNDKALEKLMLSASGGDPIKDELPRSGAIDSKHWDNAKDLMAYFLLLQKSNAALTGTPLILWVDKDGPQFFDGMPTNTQDMDGIIPALAR